MSRETLDLLECRFTATDDTGVIEAIAVRFNVVDTYRTSFDQRAFPDLERRVPMLWAHDQSTVIGSWSSFKLMKTELRARGTLNLDVARAREVRAMLLAGDIEGVSIGFETIKDERRSGGIRHITQAKIHEISLVALPSVPGAKVTQVRSGRDSATADFISAVRSATRAFTKGN